MSSRRRAHLCILLSGYSLFLVGLAVLLTGTLTKNAIDKQFDSRIIDRIVISSKDSKGYERWITNHYEGAPPLYEGFYLYNLTNFEDVIHHRATPVYNEVGPYIYRELHDKLDVTWTDEGNKVTYWDYAHFVYEPSLSVGDPYKDVIYNINPAFLGVILQAKSDFLFTIAFTGQIFKEFLQFLTTEFVTVIVVESSPVELEKAREILSDPNNSSFFFAQWANATKDFSPQWKGMRVSKGTPSGIQLLSAKQLFDSKKEYSLVHKNSTSTRVWANALLGNEGNQTFLQDHFQLTPQQLQQILDWLEHFFLPLWVEPPLLSHWKVNSTRDLGWLQWGEGSLTNDKSVQTLFPEKQFPIPPELPMWWYSYQPIAEVTLNISTSQKLMNGSYGLFDPKNVGDFFEALTNMNWTLVEDRWGLDGTGVAKIVPYLLACAQDVSRSHLEDLFKKGAGIVTKRTVNEWLWNATDPLLELVQPSMANVRMVVNFTSPADTLANSRPSTFYTGLNDPSQVMKYILWEGKSKIDAFPQTYPVVGTNQGGQFEPFLGTYSKLQTWDPTYTRTLDLEPRESTEVQGINLQRYELASSTWAVNPSLTNDIPGFVNITALRNSSVFISNPHMYGVDASWREKLQGIRSPSREDDVLKVDVEPYTGKVLQAYKCLQVNLFVDPSMDFSLYFPNMTKNVMFPILWAFEQSVITPDLASELRGSLYTALRMQRILVPICVPVGVGLIVIGLVLAIFFGHLRLRFHRLPSTDYQPLVASDGEDSD